MTNKEAIDVINRECERTFLLLTCSNEFAHALERSINALEKMETVRAEVIEEFKKKCKDKRYKPSKFTSINVVDYADIDEIAEHLKEQK